MSRKADNCIGYLMMTSQPSDFWKQLSFDQKEMN